MVFLSMILSVAIGGHAYLLVRHVFEPGWPDVLRLGLLAALGSAFAALFLYPFGRARVPRRLGRAWAWTASVWLGVAFLLLTTTAATDAALWLLGAAAPAGDVEPLLRARSIGVAGLVGITSAVALRNGLAAPAHRRVEIELPRWPASLDGLRLVQLSDLHLGPLLDRRFAAQLVQRVNALEPDLVAVTGDLVDGSVRRVGEEVAPFAGLRARHGVFFVTGNHDFYSGADSWTERMRGLGWHPLRNERVAIRHGAGVFELAGVDDHHGSLVEPGAGEDLERALAGRDARSPLVLLAHDPSTFRKAAASGVDLQISGHTHGGQIWPFHGVVRLAVRWVAGLHRLEGSALYVSRGTGFWGPPMRLLAPAELTELVLRTPRRGSSGPEAA